MKKIEEDFIGSIFYTQNGSTLTVTGKNVGKYTVECSKCSKDKELFPEPFTIESWRLKKGVIPCGCSKAKNWTEEQYKIRVLRKCKEKGYALHGWAGEYLKARTKLKLYNPVTGNEWESTDINGFLSNDKEDPVLHRIKTSEKFRKDDEYFIEIFKSTGKFKEGTKFTRTSNNDWTYTCPVCSDDEYVRAGVCSGIFKSLSGTLKNGGLSCRCSNRYTPTEELREYQIKKVLKREGGKFLNWVDTFRNSNSKFDWLCDEGHPCKTSVSKFLSGQRCPSCAGSSYGYFFKRKDEYDTLYISTISSLDFFKIGRSFEPERRLKENTRRINKYYNDEFEVETSHTFSSDHKTIFNLEQLLIGIDRDSLYNLDRPEDTYGSSELIKNKYYEEVVEFCKDYIDEWWK